MNNLIQKIKTTILENRKNIIWLAFFIMLFWADNSFAAGEGTDAAKASDWTDVVKWVNWLLLFVTSWLWLMTGLVMKFLEPGWTTWSVFGLNDILKNIWVMISNIVYFIFAFLLIAIAFMNIIWKWDNNYQLKTALPKLIMWIIMVPFTWFIVQFIISISTLLTASVIQLPYDVFKWSETQKSIINDIKIPVNCTVDLSASSGSGVTCSNEEKDKKPLSELLNSKDTIGWVIWFYSFWLINIWSLTSVLTEQISNKDTWWISTVFDLWLKIIIDVVFVIAYLILLRAIALALFTRWIYLWFYAMFSPIFWLIYFFWKSMPSWMKKLEILTIPKLIWLAFVPVYVAAALSFWFIFLVSAWHWLSWFTQDKYNTPASWTTTASWFTAGGIHFSIKWANNGKRPEWSNAALWVLAKWWDLVWQFIIQLFGIAVLWMVVMAALSSSTITESVVKPIADFGWSIWKTVMKLPQYAPIFPGWMSAASMSTVWSNISWAFESTQNKKWTDFYNKTFWNWDKVTQKATEINPKIDNAKWDIKQLSNLTQDLLKEVKDTQQLANSTQWIESLKKIANEMKIDKDKIDKVKYWDRDSVANLLIEMDKKAEWVLWADIFTQKWNKLNWYASIDSAIKDLWNSNLIPKVKWDININLNNLTNVWIDSKIENWKANYSIWKTDEFSKYIKENKSEFWWDNITKEWLKKSLIDAWLDWDDDKKKIDEVINELEKDKKFFKEENKS